MYSIEIEVYTDYGNRKWAQAKYLVRGITDLLWTDDLDEAVGFLHDELARLEPTPASAPDTSKDQRR